MKKNFKIALLTGISIFVLLGSVVGTYSWFESNVTMQMNGKIDGESAAAYFAYGNGSAEKPFGITTPRHVYNLAWLQYNGMFNKDTDNNRVIDKQFYFVVGNKDDSGNYSPVTINMTGWELPPIGTETYPFLGNFDGKGSTITNLSVSNKTNLSHPNSIPYAVCPEIVGFFGVVGKLDNLPYSYTTSINTVTDIKLNNITIQSRTAHTLAGLAAGYVNADISKVLVNGNATLDVDGETTTTSLSDITSNISDFGLVGYTTKTNRSGTYRQDISAFYDSEDSAGSGDNWGGSIAIDTIFNRLSEIRSNYAVETTTLPTEITYTYDSQGNVVSTEATNTASDTVAECNENTHNGSYNNKIGAFQMGDTRDDIHYLSGGHFTRKRNEYNHQGYFITDGTHYLKYDGSSLTDYNGATPNSRNGATIWHFVSAGGSSYYIRTNYEGSSDNRYLYNDNGELKISTGTSTNDNAKWTVTQSGNQMTISNGGTKIHCLNNVWSLIPTTDKTIYYLKSGDNYVSASSSSGTTLANTTSKDAAAQFYIESGTNYLYFYSENAGNQKMYLAIYYHYESLLRYVTSSTYDVRAISSLNQSEYNYLIFSGGNLYTTIGVASNGAFLSGQPTITNTTTYLAYNGGWTYTQTSSSKVNPTAETASFSSYKLSNTLANNPVSISGPDSYNDGSDANNYMDYSGQDVTYFPLNTKADYTPADNNTGYIIGGSSYTSDNTDYGHGNVRIANFYQLSDTARTSGNIGNYSSSTHKLSNVRTYGSSGKATIDDNNNDFEKYADSKEKVEAVLKARESSNTVCGLHFMNDAISANSLVTARYAQINTTPYSNYQLPASSIDFNLKERGYINFFAGTYGQLSTDSDNNVTTVIDAFFSLHFIKRSSNAIVDIYEIEQILSDGNQDHAYIYKLKTGAGSKYTIPYSYNQYNQKTKYVLDTRIPLGDQYPDEEYTIVDTVPSTYSAVFDTAWIKGEGGASYDQHVMYYFEIPINCGEYCLGSVPNSHFGAYLVYLDIGAFARDDDVVHAYSVTTHSNALPYPVGVDFNVAGATAVTGGDSLCVYISSGVKGSVTFVVSSNLITIDDDSSLATYAFKGAKYADSGGDESKFTVDGDPPGALVTPAEGGERLIHTTIDAIDGATWRVDILDKLDAQGNITSTTYPLIKRGDADMTVSDIPTALIDTLDSKIRTLGTIAILTRSAGTREFVATATYDDETRKVVSVSVDAQQLEGTSIVTTGISTGYTIKINGTTVTNNSTYPTA